MWNDQVVSVVIFFLNVFNSLTKFNQIIILLATFHCPNYLFLARNLYKT